jgi:hypothetical protein
MAEKTWMSLQSFPEDVPDDFAKRHALAEARDLLLAALGDTTYTEVGVEQEIPPTIVPDGGCRMIPGYDENGEEAWVPGYSVRTIIRVEVPFEDWIKDQLQYAADRILIEAYGACPICGKVAEEHSEGFDSCPTSTTKPLGILAALDAVKTDTPEVCNGD